MFINQGFYVAIQGPTLIDLIEMLHINNDIMSYTVALSSLAYSFGGLLGGFLFNYIDRQILIPIYYIIFGVSNIAIPFMTNYVLYTVINVFKMMCAGGTDAGANVWILDLWPGQDSWLQALHFTFAVGCALGPLLVEPFLSADTGTFELNGKTTGNMTIPDIQSESRIYIPFGVSGGASIIAAFIILYLGYTDPARKQQRRERKISHAAVAAIMSNNDSSGANSAMAQQLVKPLLIPLMQVAGQQPGSGHHSPVSALHTPSHHYAVAPTNAPLTPSHHFSNLAATQLSSADLIAPASRKVSLGSMSSQVAPSSPQALPQQQQPPNIQVPSAAPQTANQAPLLMTARGLSASQQSVANLHTQSPQLAVNQQSQASQPPVKITSKKRADVNGTPYYVMLAIALAAMCLSSYCGVEITSMNYLATFVVNLEMQIENRKSTAALMSSALTVSFAVGRGIGIWLAVHMKPHVVFYFCLVIMGLGNFAMLVFANMYEPGLWASICLFGVGCGPMFPAIVSFFDDKISKVTNTVSGIFILGSMFNVAMNSLIIGHHVMDNALILIYCNLFGTFLLLCLFATLHMLTKVKKSQRVKKFKKRQQSIVVGLSALDSNTAPISIVTTANVASAGQSQSLTTPLSMQLTSSQQHSHSQQQQALPQPLPQQAPLSSIIEVTSAEK